MVDSGPEGKRAILGVQKISLRRLAAIASCLALVCSALAQAQHKLDLDSEPIQPLPQIIELDPDKVELGANWRSVINRLSADTKYKDRFQKIYGGGITKTAIQDAIATYERSLITPNARFDRYLNGDADAISQAEKEGYALFKSLGCSACHQGRNVGGNMFQKFGVMRDYFAQRGNIKKADLGRFNVTGREEDRHVFKVPSLRNIELTAPYFHDASVDTLEAAVDIMVYYQLGRRVSDEDRTRLVAFLKTLTGEYQVKPLWQS